MTLSKSTILPFFLAPMLFAVSACTSAPSWNPANSSRELGVVRVAYEYPKFQEPTMSDAQAVQLAQGRCSTWGYARAEMIPGELRDCSVKDGESCELWKITREYRCDNDGAYAQSAAR